MARGRGRHGGIAALGGGGGMAGSLDELRAHQPRVVAHAAQQPRPVVGATAGLEAHQARFQTGHELPQRPSSEHLLQNYLPRPVRRADMERGLAHIDANSGYLHLGSARIVGSWEWMRPFWPSRGRIRSGANHSISRFRLVASLGRAGLSPAGPRRWFPSCLSVYMVSSIIRLCLAQ